MEPRITSTSPSSAAIIPWVSRYTCSWAPVSYSPSTTTGACARARVTSPFSMWRCLRTLSAPHWIWSGRDGRRKSSTGGSGSTTTSTACTARRSASRSGWARSRTGSCTWRTTPAANTGWSCSIKYTTFGPGRSRWSTTTNCDQSTARPKRIAVMLPRGEGGGLRTVIPHRKSSRGRSSTYRSRPVSLASPSRRCNTAPIECGEAGRLGYSGPVRGKGQRGRAEVTSGAHISRRVEHLAHLTRQTIRREGLLEVGDPGLQDAVVDDGFVGIARRVQHPHVGSQPHQLVRQLSPAHPRHHHVGEEQVDRTVVLGRELQRGFSVWRLQDGVAVPLEHLSGHHANRGRILDQQHGLRALTPFQGVGGYCTLARRLARPRQVDLEACTMPGLGIHPDEPAGLLHDPVHRGEAQTRSLARLFGREERLEVVALCF